MAVRILTVVGDYCRISAQEILVTDAVFVLFCIGYSLPYSHDAIHLEESRPAFTSIQSCVDALREPGDECIIPAGRYFEQVEITNKHGSPEKPMVIRGIGDHYPIIDGTVEIKPKEGWVKYANAAYKATLEEDIWQLFIDGEMMTNARWPNALWSDKTVFNSSFWAKSSNASTRGVMVENGVKDLAGSGLNATGAMAILNIGSFNTFTAVVRSHKPGTSSFTYLDNFGPKILLHFW
ncbi:uncharacterized protein [Montipora foliosa]|uniref:uncharacterized protein n=1 Tax=Montipora foliosa TaxID=591990 RepID=UPI0035F1C2EB